MAVWMASALRMLLGGLALGAGAEAATALIPGGVPSAFQGDVFVGDAGRVLVGGHKHRRRRRRALTASDKADIGFIVGLLGPAAGKQFAVTIATRHG